MKKQFEKILNNRNLTQEELGINLDREEFSLKEIYNLSHKLNISVKNLIQQALGVKFIITVRGLRDAIENNDIDLIESSIIDGYIVNLDGKLYLFHNNNYISKSDEISDELAIQLLKVLLINNKHVAARLITDKNLINKIKINDIYDEKYPKETLLKYFLGENYNKAGGVDTISDNFYSLLNDKSKEYIKPILVNNYNNIVESILKDLKNGYEIDGPIKHLITTKKCDEDFALNIYFIDENYKYFEKEEQLKIEELLNKITKK